MLIVNHFKNFYIIKRYSIYSLTSIPEHKSFARCFVVVMVFFLFFLLFFLLLCRVFVGFFSVNYVLSLSHRRWCTKPKSGRATFSFISFLRANCMLKIFFSPLCPTTITTIYHTSSAWLRMEKGDKKEEEKYVIMFVDEFGHQSDYSNREVDICNLLSACVFRCINSAHHYVC